MHSECEELADALARLLSSLTPSECAISFSGGLDSSIIAYIFRRENISLHAVGFEGSHDLLNARKSAEILGLPLGEMLISDEDVSEAIVELWDIAGPMSAVEISFELPLYFVARDVHEDICTGQGADELFGGYAKYLEHEELMEHDLNTLLQITAPREKKMVQHFGHTLNTPYLSEDIVEFSKKVPVDCKIRNGVRKYVLREAARIIGVPEEIVTREKKAAQYGSGIWKSMRRQAKRSGLSVEGWIKTLIKRN